MVAEVEVAPNPICRHEAHVDEGYFDGTASDDADLCERRGGKVNLGACQTVDERWEA